MSTGRKTLDTQYSSSTIDLSKKKLGRPLNTPLNGHNREAETGHLLA